MQLTFPPRRSTSPPSPCRIFLGIRHHVLSRIVTSLLCHHSVPTTRAWAGLPCTGPPSPAGSRVSGTRPRIPTPWFRNRDLLLQPDTDESLESQMEMTGPSVGCSVRDLHLALWDRI